MSQQPYVEDYHSDDSDHVLEYRRSPAAAPNVSAKRSHPSDLNEKPPSVVNTSSSDLHSEKVVSISDVTSDSGYSSHTVATMSSSNSAPSANSSQSPPTAPASTAPVPPLSPSMKRRPTLGDERKSSSQNSPRKPLQRTSSVSSRRPPRDRRPTTTEAEECTDPNCTRCGPNARPPRSRRSELSPLDSGLDISYAPFSDERSQRSDPATSYTTPPSPAYSRQRTPYAQGPVVLQPAQTRRRSSSSQRPMSYHGEPGQHYWVPGMPAPYPSPPQEHGPPPSMSAHFNMHSSQMSPFIMGATPPNGFYPGHLMQQTSPPYDNMQRPQLPSRNSSGYNTRRPMSGYGPALVTYDNNKQPMPSARYPNAPQSARQERFFESESSEYESSDEEQEDPRRNDRALMPPPKLKPASTQRRPSLRHANTAQIYNADHRMSMSQSQMLPERPRERDPRDSKSTRVSRTSSVSRPALIQHPKAQSAMETSRNAKVLVENSKSQRRQSYQAYGKEYEIEDRRRRNRDSKIYFDEPVTPVAPAPSRRRRPTDAESHRGDEYIDATKERRTTLDAEAYQRDTRGSSDPLTEQIHRAAKRASRVPSGPSDAGSSRSKGSDGKSRISQSNRTTTTNGGGNGEIRLRVDASAPLSLQFNGDMEGRVLQINPAENGMADIVIANSARGNENLYRSERGSVMGSSKRSVVTQARGDARGDARREAEEVSVRSSRSSQSRRDVERRVERRVLRRRRDTEYN